MTKEELKRKISEGESLNIEFKKCQNELGEGIFEKVKPNLYYNCCQKANCCSGR
jgi:hypothetical protein